VGSAKPYNATLSSLQAQLSVANCETEVSMAMMQHQIDTGNLILRCKELGLNMVSVREMTELRAKNALRLEEIIKTYESFGSPPRDESQILNLLLNAEKHATNHVREVEATRIKLTVQFAQQRPITWKWRGMPSNSAWFLNHQLEERSL
jgi:hypothetical protein